MPSNLQKGDRVQWNYRGSKVVGTVLKAITEPTTVGGRRVAASKDDPRYLVKSEKTGKEAAHKATALRRLPKR